MRITLPLFIPIAVLFSATLAFAEDPPSDEWQFQMSTYLWAPALKGDATIKGAKTSVDASFIDIVKKADSIFAYNGQFGAKKGNLILEFSPSYMKLGVDDSDVSGGPFNSKIDAETEITFLELAAFYRIGVWPQFAEEKDQKVFLEPLFGARYTRLTGDLDIKFPLLGTKISQDDTKDWVDPFFGARTVIKMTDKLELSLRGDLGGFGVGSDFSWQAVGGLGYQFSFFGHDARAFAGYRALYQDYEDGSGANKFEWDMTLHGPILGASVIF